MPPEKRQVTGTDSYAVCTNHLDCQGISLIENHDTECPFDAGEDCDNDTCWRGCKHCVMQGELN